MPKYVKTKKPISHKNLLREIAQKVNRQDIDVAEKYLIAMAEVIIQELKINGTCKVRYLGTFNIKQTGGKEHNVPLHTGGQKMVWIDPKQSATFAPSSTFKWWLNDETLCPRDMRLEKLKNKHEAVKEIAEIEEAQIRIERAENLKKKYIKERKQQNG